MGRGRQLIRSKILMSTLRSLTMVICCKFKKDLINLWYTSFHVLINYIAACQRQTIPEAKILMSTEQKPLVTSVICYKFTKKSLSSLILYNFFHYFIHIYSPGAGADNPLGMKFWCQQEHLVTLVICCKFQKNLFEVWFYTFFFHDFTHVYSPGAGADSPQGTKFWFQQKCLVTSFICYKFQKNVFEVWI